MDAIVNNMYITACAAGCSVFAFQIYGLLNCLVLSSVSCAPVIAGIDLLRGCEASAMVLLCVFVILLVLLGGSETF